MDFLLFPPGEQPEAVVDLPLSKSISNRVLIVNALAGSAEPPCEVAKCSDTSAVVAALAAGDGPVSVGAAGTAMRFLAAYFASQPGRRVTLDGSARMRRRPIGPLVDALRLCGAHIEYAGEEGYPPLAIEGRSLEGGEVALDGSVSSQFATALLLVAPTMARGLRLRLDGEAVSQPYIAMTLAIMAQWGVAAERGADGTIAVPHAHYRRPADGCRVEADWSAASYWYELQAFSFGAIALRGLLPTGSLQGDADVQRIFRSFGIVTAESEDTPGALDLLADPDLSPRFQADMSATPDLAQTVAVTCCLLGIPFHISGLRTLRIKETDRLEALRRELMKLSYVVEVDEGGDYLAWEGARCPIDRGKPIVIDTYDDHRMAMAFAPAAWFAPGLVIRHAEVVAKSYPAYWDHLHAAGFDIRVVPDGALTPKKEGEE